MHMPSANEDNQGAKVENTEDDSGHCKVCDLRSIVLRINVVHAQPMK
jgi:hypothetical protein